MQLKLKEIIKVAVIGFFPFIAAKKLYLSFRFL